MAAGHPGVVDQHDMGVGGDTLGADEMGTDVATGCHARSREEHRFGWRRGMRFYDLVQRVFAARVP